MNVKVNDHPSYSSIIVMLDVINFKN